jgi:hypothetical protein
MPVIMDGRAPASLSHAVKLMAPRLRLRDIFVMAVKEHPEFFEKLSDNNNQCADYLKNLIDNYFDIRARAATER